SRGGSIRLCLPLPGGTYFYVPRGPYFPGSPIPLPPPTGVDRYCGNDCGHSRNEHATSFSRCNQSNHLTTMKQHPHSQSPACHGRPACVAEVSSRSASHSPTPARRRSGMSNLVKSALLALALTFGLRVSAQTVTTTNTVTVAAAIPDGSSAGVASATNVSTPVVYMTGLKVNLKLTGTFNGDIYCYLTHGTNRAVLLNRVGRRASS